MDTPSTSRRLCTLLAIATFWANPTAQAAPPTQDLAPATVDPAGRLRVGIKASPPFAYRETTGDWTGISIDLWDEVADELELDYDLEVVERTEQLVDGVADGSLDLAISAITVTASREERVDFSHPYFTTGLGVVVRAEGGTGPARILRAALSWEFLTLFGSVLLALLVSGVLFWWVERRRNPQFAESRRHGLAQGLWWSTIMLFGHKGIFPVSAVGRILAATSMLVSILLLSVLTGAIASALTVGHFESLIRDVNDLRHVRTLAVEGTSSADFLRRRRIPFQSVPTLAAGLTDVAEARADAIVHDAPLLEFEVGSGSPGALEVLPRTFELQDYAIALPPGSPLREPLNGALLELRASPRWEQIQYRYLRR